MKIVKLNTCHLAGNVSNVSIQSGQNGRFGTLSIAVDDGYFKKSENNQAGQWVERTYFVELKVNETVIKKFYVQPVKGDQLVIDGKLVMESWKDKNSGQDRTAIKVQVAHVVSHTPKTLIDLGKSQGIIPVNQSQQQNQSQGGFQQNQSQGGFQQNQSQGGFQQNQPQGGFQQNQPQGGFQSQQNGFVTQQNGFVSQQ